MSNEVIGDFVDVPRPVAILLQTAYVVLLAVGFLASILTISFLLWQSLGNERPMSPSFFSIQADSDRRYDDEESREERADLEFEDDTDEEYIRRPY